MIETHADDHCTLVDCLENSCTADQSYRARHVSKRTRIG